MEEEEEELKKKKIISIVKIVDYDSISNFLLPQHNIKNRFSGEPEIIISKFDKKKNYDVICIGNSNGKIFLFFENEVLTLPYFNNIPVTSIDISNDLKQLIAGI
jgi:hypothetical protein